MRGNFERNHEGLESVLTRVSRQYAKGEISKGTFDKFAETMESAFTQLTEMERETYGETSSDPALGE
jgi:hypothetical protein